MDKTIASYFTDSILTSAAKEFDAVTVVKVGGFENFIYQFEKNSCQYILRIAHSSRRPINLVLAELDWIEYLYEHSVPVARPIKNTSGEFASEIDDGQGGSFVVAAFEKASGGHIGNDQMTEPILRHWGEVIGKMQKATANYKPVSEKRKRQRWDEEVLPLVDYLPENDRELRQLFLSAVQSIQALPETRDSFGLIHSDAHSGNFFVDNGKITLFDFDDSVYMGYAHDIAMPLFYEAVVPPAGNTSEDYGKYFWQAFMEGYTKENTLTSDTIATVPLYLKMREILLYTVVLRSLNPTNLRGWIAQFMDKRRDLIINNVPVVPIEFK